MKGNHLIALLLTGAVLPGCTSGPLTGQPRFKGVEAYKSAVEPNTYDKLGPMDPYSYGGTAYASGGLAPAASYGTGADDPFDGDPMHYEQMAERNGLDVGPVDWSGSGVLPADTSGYVVPEPPKPITDDEPEKK